jgi:hypothetical protein
VTATQIYEWTLYAMAAIALAGGAYNSVWIVHHNLKKRTRADKAD